MHSVRSLVLAFVVAAAVLITGTCITCSFGNEWTCASLASDFSISSTTPNDMKWDIGGNGAPDPYGRLTVARDGRAVSGGSESIGMRSDAFGFTAPFFRQRGITIHRDDVITIRLFDDDLGDDDVIGIAYLTVAGRTMRGSAENGAFSVTVTCEE